jgi:hypothetical protein
MASKNDGLGMGPAFWAPLPGQDRKHFPLGTCKAPPARGYWAGRAGLSNDYQVEEAIAGLSDPQEIKAKLIDLSGHDFARDYMTYYKMGWTY